ncbi:MAG: CHRD domain-containing protein [Nitrosopumilus sp.]|uniref:CHRD domain-containing protein n=1 Tax=Nitrosopumilus sp. TaxID=2024843 RepID=UPI00247E4ACD|nr:CHRD domain-containing protein [Nitrosopumilus sp.]MCV0393447.1 CHRD domain-containing protein [Nitrosopumilus sp.]
MKQNNSVLGLSIVAIFAITVIAITAVPDALAKPSGNGQPDLIANLTAEGTNDTKGKAMFWFNDDATELQYKIVLNKVDVGSVGEDGNGKDKNSGKGLEYYVTKLHIHAAPGGIHTGEHLLNIVGPIDDNDLKIVGHTFSGIWDDTDMTHDHHGHGHNTKTLTSQIDALCNRDTDVNVHLSGSDEFIRGVIDTNSDKCSEL